MSTGEAAAVLHALVVGALTLGCSSGGNQLAGDGGHGGTGGQGGAGNAPTTTETITIAEKGNPKVDILFVLDDGSSSTEIKQKLYLQMPVFLNVLKGLPTPLDLHIAVTTTDLGAPGDVTDANCQANGNAAPCWTLVPGPTDCAGQTVAVAEDPSAPSSLITVSCQVCQAGASVPGC